MSLNNVSGTTYSSALLIADTYQLPNGSNDSLPPFTLVNGFPASTCLELQSTLGALLISRMTTAQKNDLNAANGMVVFDTTLNDFQFYVNGWVGIPAVVIPTVANDIAIFDNTTGTLSDSGVRLLQSFGQQTLFLGENTGNSGALAGNSVIAFGLSTIPVIDNGSTNSTCVGSGVGLHVTDIDGCCFVGTDIASAVGAGALNQLTAFGSSALENVLSAAVGSTAIGYSSQFSVTTASKCTSVGWGTLQNITVDATASEATALGYSSLFLATTAAATTAIGSNAGSAHTQYTSCTFLGQNADATVNNLVFASAIGAGATVAQSNSMVLGAPGTLVGINTSTPVANFHINGSIAFKQPVVVAPGSFPYIASVNDYMIIGFPTGAGNVVQLPDATAANVGKTYRISNSSSGADQITVTTTSGQPVQNSILNIIVGADFISAPDGVGGYRYYSCY